MALPPRPERAARAVACLVVLDGWGLAPTGPGQRRLAGARRRCSTSCGRATRTRTLTACGRAVGLPEGQMGNSEVGHLNLGAGAVVRQDLTRIDDAVADGVARRERGAARGASPARERVHLIGLVSDGGVHSSLEHLRALIALARELGVPDLVVHAFTDGRDTLPDVRRRLSWSVEGWMRRRRCARVGSVVGRYWAMDRDRRWERTSAPTTCSCTAAAEHRAARRARRCARPTRAARPTSSSSRRSSATRTRGSGPATACSRSTSAPTGCARSRARWPSRGFGEGDRGGRGGRSSSATRR